MNSFQVRGRPHLQLSPKERETARQEIYPKFIRKIGVDRWGGSQDMRGEFSPATLVRLGIQHGPAVFPTSLRSAHP